MLAASLRELVRLAARQLHRGRLALERRRLAQLETALGLLGWQQADYDDRTQEHVREVTDYERAQAGLTNESAALALQIQEIEARRGIAEREFSEAESAALEREHPAAKTPEALHEQLAAARQELKAIEAREPVLVQELRAAEEQYRRLVVPDTPSAAVQAEQLRLRKVILAVPQERAEWHAKAERCRAEIAKMESLSATLHEARAEFANRDSALADEIATRQRAKRKVEKQIDELEKAKGNPYREIGRALADYDIAPVNQPEALAAVLAQRERIADRETALAASLAESARHFNRT